MDQKVDSVDSYFDAAQSLMRRHPLSADRRALVSSLAKLTSFALKSKVVQRGTAWAVLLGVTSSERLATAVLRRLFPFITRRRLEREATRADARSTDSVGPPLVVGKEWRPVERDPTVLDPTTAPAASGSLNSFRAVGTTPRRRTRRKGESEEERLSRLEWQDRLRGQLQDVLPGLLSEAQIFSRYGDSSGLNRIIRSLGLEKSTALRQLIDISDDPDLDVIREHM